MDDFEQLKKSMQFEEYLKQIQDIQDRRESRIRMLAIANNNVPGEPLGG